MKTEIEPLVPCHVATGNMRDLLAEVQRLTGRCFLGGYHRRERVTAWFDAEEHAWFSSRPFPVGPDSLPPSRRLSEELPEQESFFRLDLELDDHSATPTDADIRSAVELAQGMGAMGAARTPHGLHIYLLTNRPLSYDKGEVRHCLRACWPKSMALKVCSASWSRNNWSRYVPELIFFSPTARVDVDPLLRSFSTAAVETLSASKVWRTRHRIVSPTSEPEKNEECSQIMGSLWRGHSRDQIVAKLVHHSVAELDALISRTKSDPAYAINGINATGRRHRWFHDGAKQRKYWSADCAQIGLVGPHSSSRQIQINKGMSANFGHAVQRIWDRYERRYRVANGNDQAHLRNEAIGAALLWLERSKDEKVELFRMWWQQQFPGKEEKGAAHWLLAAQEDLGALWEKFGPAGTGRATVGEKLKRRILASLRKSSSNTPDLATSLGYSDRQIRRALHELETKGAIYRTGANRHQHWHVIQPADQGGQNATPNPDIHENPVEGLHGKDAAVRQPDTVAVVAVKSIEVPPKRPLKSMTGRRVLVEQRRRAYRRELRGIRSSVKVIDLKRLLQLPREQAESWATRLEDFRREWCVYCRRRWIAWREGQEMPSFGEWLTERP